MLILTWLCLFLTIFASGPFGLQGTPSCAGITVSLSPQLSSAMTDCWLDFTGTFAEDTLLFAQGDKHAPSQPCEGPAKRPRQELITDTWVHRLQRALRKYGLGSMKQTERIRMASLCAGMCTEAEALQEREGLLNIRESNLQTCSSKTYLRADLLMIRPFWPLKTVSIPIEVSRLSSQTWV